MATPSITLMDAQEALTRLEMPKGLRLQTLGVGAAGAKISRTHGQYTLRFSRKHTYPILTEEAMDSLFEAAHVPKSLGKNTPEEMVTPILEYHLGKLERVTAITDNGGLVRLVMEGDRQPAFDPTETLEHIQSLYPDTRYQQAVLSPDYSTMNLLTIIQQEPERLEKYLKPGTHQILPKGGDPFMAGAHLKLSPLGLEAPTIEPYMVRLVCTNGAIHAEYISAWGGTGYGEGDEVWQWFREGMTKAVESSSRVMDSYGEMTTHEIPDGDQRMLAVEGMIRAARLPREMATAIRDRAISDPPHTMFDLWNIFTAVATHNTPKVGDQIKYMRRAGDQVASSTLHQYCPTCHRN